MLSYSSRSILSIACAANLAAPMARITVAAPVATSPPACTFRMDVRNSSSTITLPLFPRFNSGSSLIRKGFCPCAIAAIKTSASRVKWLPSMGAGSGRPVVSRSHISILMHRSDLLARLRGGAAGAGDIAPSPAIPDRAPVRGPGHRVELSRGSDGACLRPRPLILSAIIGSPGRG